MIIMKKSVSIIIVVVLVLGGLGVYKTFSAKAATQNNSSQFASAKVSQQNIKQSVSGSGSVLSGQTQVINSVGRDTVKSLLVSKDEVVTKGQELISFENGSAAIIAPYNGVISDINVSVGDEVMSGQQLLTIFDNKDLITTISVDETDLPDLKIGQKAEIKANAYPDIKFTGIVKDISQQGTYANGVSSFDVTLSIDHILGLKVGMSTEVSIVTASKPNVLAVPIEAVKDIRGSKYVIVPQANGTSKIQKVEVGISDGTMVEITNGLVVGEVVQLPQIQSTTTSSSKVKGVGGFSMMQGGGFRNGGQGMKNSSTSNTSK
jgi:multidrug efflux pump subunit AcrA (membrane-fusion protein)